jgi:hypothetical protein
MKGAIRRSQWEEKKIMETRISLMNEETETMRYILAKE